MDELVAAASAALGTDLTDPADLGGSERSVVLRCLSGSGGTVIVKGYPHTCEGQDSFAAEAAGLALAGPAGRGPRLLAACPQTLAVVMTDLGTAPSLADRLLSGPAPAAESALLDWARACGELAVGTAGRQRELAGLLAAYRIAPATDASDEWLARSVEEIPALLAELPIEPSAGLEGDLADVASILRNGRYEVFSPGDICPDNNLLTADGVRFVDFESAEYHCAFLDAAYLRMPFSTCWCVFRLPDELARSAETIYRDQVSRIFPDLASDAIWEAGLKRAVAAWTLHAMKYLLDRSASADLPMIDDGRAAPTARQLLRYRWRRLLAELAPAAELPALCALADQLLSATDRWQAPDLPLYPALRQGR
jgi:hypothetical protein